MPAYPDPCLLNATDLNSQPTFVQVGNRSIDVFVFFLGSPHTGMFGLPRQPPPYRNMLPSMNAYEQWTATPGMPGEPLENVALTLKFEAMGAQVRDTCVCCQISSPSVRTNILDEVT